MSDHTIEQHFTAWHNEIFPFGYGTGEEHTVYALREFMLATELSDSGNYAYEYDKIEKKIGKVACWMLINILCKCDIIEYGSSPRFAWLTKNGSSLRNFLAKKTLEELYDLACDFDEDVDSTIQKDNPFFI